MLAWHIGLDIAASPLLNECGEELDGTGAVPCFAPLELHNEVRMLEPTGATYGFGSALRAQAGR